MSDIKQRENRTASNWAAGGGRARGCVRMTELLFDLSLTSRRPQTDMCLPSGLAYRSIIPADLFLNVNLDHAATAELAFFFFSWLGFV